MDNDESKVIMDNTNDEGKNSGESKDNFIENNSKDTKLALLDEKRIGFNKNSKDKKRKIIVISLIIAIVIILSASIFVCINKLNTNVYNNVYIFGENISGYNSNEVKNILNSKNNIKFDEKISIFQDTENIYTILVNDIDIKIDVLSTLNNIMSFGRTGDIFVDSLNIFKSIFKRVEIEPVYSYDDKKLDEIIKNIDLSIKDRFLESKYSIGEENKNLVITIGKSGNGIDFNIEEEKILNNVKRKFFNQEISQYIYLDIRIKSDLELNVNEIYNNIKREPKDAYIDKTTTPAKAVAEVVGLDIDFDLLRETLENEENKVEGKSIEIPLKVIEPNVKLEDLNKELYNDKLAGYTTYFEPSQYARSNNLKIALEYLNGKVIMPGEIFSYNDTIGDTNATKGYLPAATFKGGTTVNEMGGGICQTTSTLYNVVLMANLEIVERHQHGLPVGYVQPSRDATVYSPYLDFKFKNTRSNPIKIVTSYSSSGNLNISLYGIKEKDEYEVELISQYLDTIPYSTKYVYDENMNEGNQVVISAGVNGYTSQCFIQKKLNGVQVSYELLSKDTYNPQQQVIKLGTKKVHNTQES